MSVTSSILVVDDDPIFKLKVCEHLRCAHGCSVVDVEDGNAAITALKKARPTFDLIITDLAMPDMDGIELLGFLSAIRYDNPIILVSGEFELTVKMAGIIGNEKNLNVVAGLPKPVSNTALDDVLSRRCHLARVA